jgi:hypothetical protein
LPESLASGVSGPGHNRRPKQFRSGARDQSCVVAVHCAGARSLSDCTCCRRFAADGARRVTVAGGIDLSAARAVFRGCAADQAGRCRQRAVAHARGGASSPCCEAVATDVIVKWWPLKPASSPGSRGLAHRQFGRSLPWRADSRAENGENPQHSKRALGNSRAR